MSPAYLPYISAVSPLYLRHISPQEGLQELRYQPGVPKVFDLKVISCTP